MQKFYIEDLDAKASDAVSDAHASQLRIPTSLSQGSNKLPSRSSPKSAPTMPALMFEAQNLAVVSPSSLYSASHTGLLAAVYGASVSHSEYLLHSSSRMPSKYGSSCLT